jgi:antitoxin VapB
MIGCRPDALDDIHQQSRPAVRLPKAVAFPEDVHQVDILKIGRSRVIVPQGWDHLFQNGPRVSEDFMVEREQPVAEESDQHFRWPL